MDHLVTWVWWPFVKNYFYFFIRLKIMREESRTGSNTTISKTAAHSLRQWLNPHQASHYDPDKLCQRHIIASRYSTASISLSFRHGAAAIRHVLYNPQHSLNKTQSLGLFSGNHWFDRDLSVGTILGKSAVSSILIHSILADRDEGISLIFCSVNKDIRCFGGPRTETVANQKLHWLLLLS